jgi:tetratricopeptide (TPR) repeat protein
VLNTLGVISMMQGDLRQARVSIEEAATLAASSSERVRALTNLAVLWDSDGYGGEAGRYGRLANDAALRMGDKMMQFWAQTGEIQEVLFAEGNWDETLERATAYLAATAAIGGHYLDPGIRLCRAYIYAARAEDAAAEEDLELALAAVNLRGRDVQAIAPTLNVAAGVNQLLGKHDHAVELVDRLLEIIRTSTVRAPGLRADNAAVFYRAGRADEWLELVRAKFAETGRVWAATLLCSGNAADAAEIYSHISSANEEAVARLLGAEQLIASGRRPEADVQLQKALSFYSRAGAPRIVAQAEALLAAAS